MNENMVDELVVVVFGSAARVAETLDRSREPGDVDVAWSVPAFDESARETARKQAEEIAKKWACSYGFGDKNLDLRRMPCEHVAGHRRICLPKPEGATATARLLHGEAEIVWQEYRGIAATVRALGHDAALLRDTLVRGQANFAPGVWELSLAESPVSNGDWDESYCDGLTALRSAIGHCAPGVWEKAIEGVAWAPLVSALLARGVSEDGLVFARSVSSGGGARIFLGFDRVRTQYGPSFGYAEAEAEFAVPLPLLFNMSILTSPGAYTMDPISEEIAREIVKDGFTSAIGHEATARAFGKILGVDVAVNRIPAAQKRGQKAVILRLRERQREGAILDDETLARVGYDLFELFRTR